MGSCCSSSVKEDYGFIYLELDKINLLPGEKIDGLILLSLSKDFPGSNISLNFEGEEFCQWPQSTFTASTPLKKKILSKNVEIYRFEEGIAKAGDYNFPISFTLDSDLPATYTFANSKIKASVSYKMTGCLNSYNPSKVSSLLFEQPLTVFQSKIRNYDTLSRAVDVEGKSLWCFPKGYTKLEAILNKNNFRESDVCHITCTINNKECNLEVESIEVNLLRIIEFKSDKKVEFRKKIVLKKLQLKLYLPAGHRTVIKHEFEVTLLNEKHEIHFNSTLGNMIKNLFFIEVNLTYGWSGSEKKPQILIPILIHQKPVSDNKNINYDEQFEKLSLIRQSRNPRQMPQQNIYFELDNRFEYPKLDENELMYDMLK